MHRLRCRMSIRPGLPRIFFGKSAHRGSLLVPCGTTAKRGRFHQQNPHCSGVWNFEKLGLTMDGALASVGVSGRLKTALRNGHIQAKYVGGFVLQALR